MVCGRVPADTYLSGEGPLCDRCFDDRIAASTGLSRLPDPPGPVAIVAADGTPHTMIYRLWRAPTGIAVRLVEQDPPPDGGFVFEEFGDHDADPSMLIDLVTVRADTEMTRRYLTPNESGGWEIRHDQDRGADEVVGRIEVVEPFGPPSVVVDGRAVTWQELGEVLSPYEGWQFVLRITDSYGDPRH
jgi:hypothetical protein